MGKRASGGHMVSPQGKAIGLEGTRPQFLKGKTASCCSFLLCCGKCTVVCISADKEGYAKETLESFKNLSYKENLSSKGPECLAKYLSQVAVLSAVTWRWLQYIRRENTWMMFQKHPKMCFDPGESIYTSRNSNRNMMYKNWEFKELEANMLRVCFC